MTTDVEHLQLRILVVDDEINIRKTLSLALEAEGHSVTAVSNSRDAMTEAGRACFDLAFVDLRLGTESGQKLIPALKASNPWIAVVAITAYGSVDAAVETMKRGAADFITKPFTPAQINLVTQRVAQTRALENRVEELQEALSSSGADLLLSSEHPQMQRSIEMARQVAASDATVLIRGESGTGKGVLARAIHGWSKRSHKPFSTVSCPSLSAQLLESELFGHAKGAFTGAVREHAGRIAISEGGTLFLDEIGDLPAELQPKLLRFLQDREYERVGEVTTRRADVRILCATNVNLEDAVRSGKFREDLFYRVNVFQIDLPPLRERPKDIVPLAERILAELSREKRGVTLSEPAAEAIKQYRWPGNVRELRNVLERALILCGGQPIGPEHLPPNLTNPQNAPRTPELASLAELEERHIRHVLAITKSLDEAAKILGVDVATLWRRRKKYGI